MNAKVIIIENFNSYQIFSTKGSPSTMTLLENLNSHSILSTEGSPSTMIPLETKSIVFSVTTRCMMLMLLMVMMKMP